MKLSSQTAAFLHLPAPLTSVTTVKGSIDMVTKNLQSTSLVAHNAHFQVQKLYDKLVLQEKLTKVLESIVDGFAGEIEMESISFPWNTGKHCRKCFME